jgi:hypothetical protein
MKKRTRKDEQAFIKKIQSIGINTGSSSAPKGCPICGKVAPHNHYGKGTVQWSPPMPIDQGKPENN